MNKNFTHNRLLLIALISVVVAVTFTYLNLRHKPKADTTYDTASFSAYLTLDGQPLQGEGNFNIGMTDYPWKFDKKNNQTLLFASGIPTGLTVNTIQDLSGAVYSFVDHEDQSQTFDSIELNSGENDFGTLAVKRTVDPVDLNLVGVSEMPVTISASPAKDKIKPGEQAEINVKASSLGSADYLETNPILYSRIGCKNSQDDPAQSGWTSSQTTWSGDHFTATVTAPASIGPSSPKCLQYMVAATSLDGTSATYPAEGIEDTPLSIALDTSPGGNTSPGPGPGGQRVSQITANLYTELPSGSKAGVSLPFDVSVTAVGSGLSKFARCSIMGETANYQCWFDDVPLGEVSFGFRAAGYQDSSATVNIQSPGQSFNVLMTPNNGQVTVSGQILGVDLKTGQATKILANIVIDNRSTQTSPEGTFTLTTTPGKHSVIISSPPGYIAIKGSVNLSGSLSGVTIRLRKAR